MEYHQRSPRPVACVAKWCGLFARLPCCPARCVHAVETLDLSYLFEDTESDVFRLLMDTYGYLLWMWLFWMRFLWSLSSDNSASLRQQTYQMREQDRHARMAPSLMDAYRSACTRWLILLIMFHLQRSEPVPCCSWFCLEYVSSFLQGRQRMPAQMLHLQ